MDNFRRPKRQNRPAVIDGIINPKQSKTAGSINDFRRGQSYRPLQASQSVGNFRQAGGFRPAPASSNISSGSAAQIGDATSPAWPKATVPPVDKIDQKAKPKKIKKRRSWRKIIKRTFLVLLILALLGGGFMGVKAYMKARKVLKGGGGAAALTANVDPSKLKGEGDGRINILLLGKGGAGHEGPDLTDTLLIASIDPVHKDAALVSIPRDFWVKPTGTTSYTKVNSVYANAKYKVLNGKKIPDQAKNAEEAGMSAVQGTLSTTLGIPIHYHTMVDFEAFRKAIDTVGGVDINVKTQLYDPTVAWENGRNPLIAAVGLQHFNGKKALLYARSRHGSARGDFDRAQRQREIIIALKDKILSAGTYSNPVRMSQLLDAFGDHVQTNFSIDEMKRLYEIGKEIPGDKVASIGLADPPNNYLTTSSVNGLSVVIPRAGIGNYKELQSFIRNTLKDSYIKNENASIAVFNGTQVAGLATKRADDLKTYGYNITEVANAPVQGVNHTILVDMRNGTKKYTRHYLEGRLNTTATSKLPAGINPGTADFVIILGQNEANNPN